MNPREKEKKEKKGAGVPWSVSAAQRGTQVLSRAPEIIVRGAVERGFMAAVTQFFSTGVGMLTLTAMVAGASFFSLWDLNRQKEEGLAKRRAAVVFNQGTYHSRSDAIQADTRGSADSLAFLTAANQGAMGQSSPAAQAVDASAQPAPQAAAQQGNDNVPNPDKGTADVAAQAQAGMGNRFGQLSSGLGGGNGLAGGGGMSGGVGRQFDSKTMVAQLPAGNGASSGTQAAATSAGVTRTAIQGGGMGG